MMRSRGDILRELAMAVRARPTPILRSDEVRVLQALGECRGLEIGLGEAQIAMCLVPPPPPTDHLAPKRREPWLCTDLAAPEPRQVHPSWLEPFPDMPTPDFAAEARQLKVWCGGNVDGDLFVKVLTDRHGAGYQEAITRAVLLA